jgi:hypothetical protein
LDNALVFTKSFKPNIEKICDIIESGNSILILLDLNLFFFFIAAAINNEKTTDLN